MVQFEVDGLKLGGSFRMITILLVEDEDSLRSYLKNELQFENYTIITAADGEEAVQQFTAHQNEIDLILLDWMLPKIDGLGVMRRVLKLKQVPIMMMTARDYIGDKVAGLDNGAEDYITKPFEIEELLARIRVIIRREANTEKATPEQYQVGKLVLDIKAKALYFGAEIIKLTPREYDLLVVLLKNENQVMTRDELLDLVWGINFEGDPNIVDVYIRYLRQKIKYDDSLIQTVRGIGYILKSDENKNEE